MLLNLFLAILLNFISSNLDKEYQKTDSESEDKDLSIIEKD